MTSKLVFATFLSMLIHTELLANFLRSVILTGRVARTDIFPLSIFIVAPVERGKTSLMLENSGDDPIVLTDFSGIGLLETLSQNKEATHIMINDLTCVTGHKHTVAALAIAVLNGLAEEGSYKIGLPRMSHLDMRGRKVGIIACCTPDLYRDNRRWWKQSGFASRLLVIQYDHSEELRIKILNGITNNNGRQQNKTTQHILQIPKISLYVDIPRKEAEQLLVLSQKLSVLEKEIGYRKLKQLRALACGHALLRNWKSASLNQKDIEFLNDIFPFLTGIYNQEKKTYEPQRI